jgi:hypothetical protein
MRVLRPTRKSSLILICALVCATALFSASRPLTARAASAYATTIIGDAPISYWRLGESSGTTAADSSSGGNPGTITGGVTLGAPGAIVGDPNTAMSFNGSTGYVSVATNSNLNMTGDFSVEAWVKPIALDGATHTIVHKGGAFCTSASPYQYRLMLYTNHWRGVVCIGSNAYTVLDPGTPSTSSWTHLVLTRSGSTLTLYDDGAAAATTTGVSGALDTSSSSLGIGRMGGAAQDYFSGGIDEVAVYNKALSASQIQNHYNVGLGSGSAPRAAMVQHLAMAPASTRRGAPTWLAELGRGVGALLHGLATWGGTLLHRFGAA